jgi:hypothetical protein
MLDGGRVPVRAGVHGDNEAKATLAGQLRERVAGLEVVVPRG